VVDEAADGDVGLQARRWQRVVEDLGHGRLLQQQLAALADPLAADLALLSVDTGRPEDVLCLAKGWPAGRARPARPKNFAGTMSSRSLISSPTRTIGWRHSGIPAFGSGCLQAQ
jgi:hypothetical protein